MSPADGGLDHGTSVRLACRMGRHSGPTSGLAPRHVQANLVVLPVEHAAAFAEFCRLNPRPCPLLEMLPAGAWEPRQTAPGADLRTDLPRYHVFRHGEHVDALPHLLDHWREDFVAFLLGCSFTFEQALLDAGLPVRHVEEGRNVPMYRTTVPCVPVPPFAGNQVVSMRPMTPAQAEQAAAICADFPQAHGPPVHIGDPAHLGIADLNRPDYGDPVTVLPGEVPVFWACGVTPQNVLREAKVPLAFTHAPGHMFVTDVRC